MNCRDVEGLCGNYLDGELPEEICDRIQRHLLQCAACREDVETLRMAGEVLRATHTRPAAGEAFIQAALCRLRDDLGIQDAREDTPGQLILLRGAG